MVLTPLACVMSAMYCACMSVGKPGWGRVVMFEGLTVRGARTRRLSGPSSMRTPVSRNVSITARRWGGWQLRISISPPALDADGGAARALDARAHLDEKVGEVRDLRLAGGVADDGLALGQRGRHHD